MQNPEQLALEFQRLGALRKRAAASHPNWSKAIRERMSALAAEACVNVGGFGRQLSRRLYSSYPTMNHVRYGINVRN